MTVAKKFENAINIVKNGVIGAVQGTLIAAAVIPALGVAAHVAGYASEDTRTNYSLKNRFETAYCFDTPDAHKYYNVTPVVNGYSADEQIKERYMASPYTTYGTMAVAGMIGAIAMAGAANRKER